MHLNQKIFFGLVLLLFFVFGFGGKADAAAITSAQAGNWSDTATWTGGVVPGNGDTVTITHTITGDQNVTIGTSPAAGTTVMAINSGGTLTMNASTTLRVRGDVSINNGVLIMSAGSSFTFDASLASSPSTTSYKMQSITGSSGHISFQGSSGNRVTVTSDRTNSAANGYIKIYASNQGYVDATYTDFSYIGSSAQGGLDLTTTTGHNQTFDHCTFDNTGRVETVVAAADNFTFTNNTMTNSLNTTTNFRLQPTQSTGGIRTITGNYFDTDVWITGTGVAGTTIENNIFGSTRNGVALNLNPSAASTIVSFKNNIFYSDAANYQMLFSAFGTIEDNYFYMIGTHNKHMIETTALAAGSITLSGNVVENADSTSNSQSADFFVNKTSAFANTVINQPTNSPPIMI